MSSPAAAAAKPKLIAAAIMLMAACFHNSTALTLCDMDEDGLTACKPSVTQPNPPPPTPECCQALSGADLKCLCSYKNSFVLPSFGIDPDLALQLPAQCNMTLPADC